MRSIGITLNLDGLYAEDKNIDYTYDKSENITEIKIDDLICCKGHFRVPFFVYYHKF
jgi:hypothetical protein